MRKGSIVRGQQVPDGEVFGAENPGAKTLETTILHQRVAFAKGTCIGKKNPLAHVVAIEIEPRGTVRGVPFDMAVIGLGKIDGVAGGDIFGRRVRLVAGLISDFDRRSG